MITIDELWLNIALWTAVWKQTTQMLSEKFNWKFYVLMKKQQHLSYQRIPLEL